MKISDEVNTIEEIVKRILTIELNIELIIVDDCSTDGTRDVLKKIKEKYPDKKIKIFYQDINQGKGAALKKGFEHVHGDYTVIQDADLEYDPQEYHKLLVLLKKIMQTLYTVLVL